MVEQTEEFMLKMDEASKSININSNKKHQNQVSLSSSPLQQSVFSASPLKNHQQSNEFYSSVLPNDNSLQISPNDYASQLAMKTNNNNNIKESSSYKHPQKFNNDIIVANKRVGPIQRPTNSQRQQQQQQTVLINNNNNNNLFGSSAIITPSQPDEHLLNSLHMWNQQLAEAAAANENATTNINTFNLLTNSFTYTQPRQNFDLWENPLSPLHNQTYLHHNGQKKWPSFDNDYLSTITQNEENVNLLPSTENLSYLWSNQSKNDYNNINQSDANTFNNQPESTLPWNSVLLNNLNDCFTFSNDGNNLIDSSRAALESLWLNNNSNNELHDADHKAQSNGNLH